MLLKKNLIILIFAVLLSGNAFAQIWMQEIDKNESENYYKIKEKFNEYWQDKELKRGNGWKQFKRWEYFWDQRLFPSGEMPDGVELFRQMQNYVKNSSESFLNDDYQWEESGPVNIPENWLSYKSSGLGRLNCVTVHPENSDIIWVGAASGGAWYTNDGGSNWNVVDISGIMSIGISDIAISKSNPNIIYLATGDQNGSQMTRGFSVGILKSTDGGNTWEQTGYEKTKNNGVLISRILINPKNSDIVIAGTNRGIITSVNGGEEWFESYSGKFVRDMEYHTTKTNIIYASTGDYYGSVVLKSIDGGSTFEQIYNIGRANRLEIEVSKAAPENVYVLASSRSTNGYEGFYKSEDEGDTWNKQSNSPNILGIDASGNSDGGQGFYDLALEVSDVNPDMIFIGGIHIWKSANSGQTWSLINHWTGNGKPYVHADQHWLEFDGTRLYSGNDGGIYYSDDLGASWTDISNGLSIAQFYKIDVYDGFEEIIIGGTQDNGTHMADEGNWYHVHGGDGMDCKINPDNPEIMYATTYYGNLNISTNGGQSFRYLVGPYNVQENGGWVTPYELDPEDPNILYIGYRNIFKLDLNQGNINKLSNYSSSTTIGALRVSKTDNKYIYFTKNNLLFRTTDGGNSWDNIYTAQNTISDIAISINDPKNVWISLSGYSSGSKVYEVINGDARNISSNLPNFPANAIIEQENAPGTLFIGTDIGVFKRKIFSEEWEMLDNKLPKVVVTDLEINYPRGYLYAGTFGRGIWKAPIIDCNLENPEITYSGETKFCQGDSLVIYKKGDYDNFIWSDGSTEDSIIVTENGTYYLMVQDSSGCTAISEKIDVEVTYIPPLTVNIPNNGNICSGDTLRLRASFGFEKYEWSTGDTTIMIDITEPGDYAVTAYTSSECSATFDDISIQVVPKPDKPEIERRNDTLFTGEAYAHRWFRDGIFLPDNNQRFFVVEENGSYTVEAINEFGCSATSEAFDYTLDVAELADDNYLIMPNPSDGIFTVKLKKNAFPEVLITNQLGQQIIRLNNINRKTIEVDLSDYPSGVYFINFIYKDRKDIRKIILK